MGRGVHHPAGRPIRQATAVLCAAVLAFGGAPRVAGQDGWRPTGERWRSPASGREFLLERDEATGGKRLLGTDGRSFRSVEEAERADVAALPRRERVLDARLRALLADPSRGDDLVGVVLVLGPQPAHEAGLAARRRHGPRLKEIDARSREILGGIAALREPDPEGRPQVGHRLEDEARLLATADRRALSALAEERRALVARMRREVIDASRAAVRADHSPLVEWIESRRGARVHGRHAILSSVSATLPVRAVEEVIERFPSVHRVAPIERAEPALDVSVPAVGASSWTGAGYSGSSSTKVAIIDSGIDASHPALDNGTVSDAAVHLAYAASLPSGTSGFGDSTTDPDDAYYHGTHVAGIVASHDSTYRGVAPGARLMNAKAFYKSVGGFAWAYEPDIMDAGDWSADHGADVVNCSFGFTGATYGNSNLALFFDALVDDLGISVVVGAGNDGPSSGTVRTPADGFNVVTVGNAAIQRTASPSDDSLSSTSSRGPLTDGRRKPDLAAPGTLIYSSWFKWETQASFTISSGTSMAAPHVAGGLALLEDYRSSWTPAAAKALLLTNARNVAPYPASPGDDWGHGGLDLAAAFTNRAGVAESGLDATGPPTAWFRLPALSAGGRATLCWNRQVVSNGSATPTTYFAPADLDLYVYDGSTGAAAASSVSGVNNVEQAKVASALSSPVVKVKRSGALPSGIERQDFALAAEAASGIAELAAPTVDCSFYAMPLVAGPDATFPITVFVRNDGGVPALAPEVTLTLPPGYTLVSGSNPRTLARLDGPALAACAWTVRSPGADAPRGTADFEVRARSDGFGETLEGSAAFAQEFEPSPPTGSLTIEGGAAFVGGTAVSLEVQAAGAAGEVVEMRFGNDASSWEGWSDWEPFAPTRDWELAPGPDGERTVWCQVRDAAGNASLLLSDRVSLDSAAPQMTFVLNGGLAYVVPTLPLRADAVVSDGNGSGAGDFRASHDGGLSWSDWIPVEPDGSAEIPRPPGRGRRTVVGQVRDRVGHLSNLQTAGIHVAEDEPQPILGARRLEGAFAEGGDIDTFGVDLVAGDVLTVTGKVVPPDRDTEIGLAFDLWDPDGVSLSTGRHPADGKREGVRRFAAEKTGQHVLVVRPVGFDSESAAGYVLRIRVRHSPAGLVFQGSSADGEILFPAARGGEVAGTFRGASLESASLLPPGGIPVAVGLAGTGGRRALDRTLLDGPTGAWGIRFEPAGPVSYRLRVRPPRPRVVEEQPDQAGP